MTPEMKLLNKTWHFRQLDQKDWTPCAIPGFVHKILFENGDIPPLYYSQNESTLQWIGEKDWIFKCIFDVDSIMLLRKKIELQFARLDTYAKLSLNGTLLGETNNAFRTWKFECKQLLKASGNELIVVVLKRFVKLCVRQQERHQC